MFRSSPQDSTLQKAVDRAVRELDVHSIASEEYEKILNRVAKLHEMKEKEKPSSISPDTLLLVASNLAGIMMIIKHEQFNVITSKALNFVTRPR